VELFLLFLVGQPLALLAEVALPVGAQALVELALEVVLLAGVVLLVVVVLPVGVRVLGAVLLVDLPLVEAVGHRERLPNGLDAGRHNRHLERNVGVERRLRRNLECIRRQQVDPSQVDCVVVEQKLGHLHVHHRVELGKFQLRFQFLVVLVELVRAVLVGLVVLGMVVDAFQDAGEVVERHRATLAWVVEDAVVGKLGVVARGQMEAVAIDKYGHLGNMAYPPVVGEQSR